MHFPLYIDPNTGSVSMDSDNQHTIRVLPVKSNNEEGCWRWGKDKVKENVKTLKAFQVNETERWNISYPVFLKSNGEMRVAKPKSTWIGSHFSTDSATKYLRAIMPEIDSRALTPKALGFMKTIIQQSMSANDICLDFFAGSGTTADTVMQLNTEDGGNRKFICVQLPEVCEKDSEAYKAGFKTIADIGKERIRRAAAKIRKEQEGKLDFDGDKLDLGFKVFKLDASNFKIWRSDVQDGKTLEKQLSLFVDNVNPDAQQDNILYELILKSGLDLNVKVEPKKAHGKQYFVIEDGKLILCLEEKITEKLVEKIISEKPEKEECKVICLDRAFAGNDQLKTNTALQMEAEKIEFKVI